MKGYEQYAERVEKQIANLEAVNAAIVNQFVRNNVYNGEMSKLGLAVAETARLIEELAGKLLPAKPESEVIKPVKTIKRPKKAKKAEAEE